MLSRRFWRTGLATARSLPIARSTAAPATLSARCLSIAACDKAAPTAPAAPVIPPTEEPATAVDATVSALSDAPTEYIPSYIDSSWMGPFDGMEFLLEYAHTNSGYEWPVVIIGLTATARVVMLPVILSVMRNTQRMARITDQVKNLSDKMYAVASTDPALAKRYQDDMQTLFKTHDCHPMKSVRGILFQAPVFMSFFFAIRRIAEADPSFAQASFLWCNDMSAPDPYFALPVMTGLSMLATIEFGSDGQQVQQNPMAKYVMRGLAVASVPLTSFFPSGLFCYWLTSNCFSLSQLALFKVPTVRDALGLLPPMPVAPPPGEEPIKFVEAKPNPDAAAPASPLPKRHKAPKARKHKRK